MPLTFHYYDEPYVGQPFRIVQNAAEGTYMYAQVGTLFTNGTFVREDGVRVRGWHATIAISRDSELRIRYDTKIEDGAQTWEPVPAEEYEKRYGPGYTALKELVERVGAAARTMDEDLAGHIDALLAVNKDLAARVEKLEAAQIALSLGASGAPPQTSVIPPQDLTARSEPTPATRRSRTAAQPAG